MTLATTADLPLLLDLMAAFYAEAGHKLHRQRAATAFTELLANPPAGRVWLLHGPNGQLAGYLVLTFCYSMEYGGQKAFVDDFFVRAPFRNAGLGAAALAEARAFCEAAGIRAMAVEVGPGNSRAQTVYRRVGFAETPDREVLTLALAAPL